MGPSCSDEWDHKPLRPTKTADKLVKIRVKNRAAIRFQMAPHSAKKRWRTPWTEMRETRFTCATQSQSCNREWWYASERKRGCRQHSGMWISFAPFHATKWVRSVVEIGPPFEKSLPSTMENRDIDCTSVILEWIHGHACYNNDFFHGGLVTTYYLDFWQVGRAGTNA